MATMDTQLRVTLAKGKSSRNLGYENIWRQKTPLERIWSLTSITVWELVLGWHEVLDPLGRGPLHP